MVIITSVVAGQREAGTGTPGTTNMAKASGISIARGDVLMVDTATTPDSLKTATSGAVGPFYYAEQEALTGTTGVSVGYDGEVALKGNEAIEVNDFVVVGTTAGRVIARAEEKADKVGVRYLRHPGEKSPGSNSPPTALADAEIGIFHFAPGRLA